jgi:hypothetical protein
MAVGWGQSRWQDMRPRAAPVAAAVPGSRPAVLAGPLPAADNALLHHPGRLRWEQLHLESTSGLGSAGPHTLCLPVIPAPVHLNKIMIILWLKMRSSV